MFTLFILSSSDLARLPLLPSSQKKSAKITNHNTVVCCKDRERIAASDWLAKYTHMRWCCHGVRVRLNHGVTSRELYFTVGQGTGKICSV